MCVRLSFVSGALKERVRHGDGPDSIGGEERTGDYPILPTLGEIVYGCLPRVELSIGELM